MPSDVQNSHDMGNPTSPESVDHISSPISPRLAELVEGETPKQDEVLAEALRNLQKRKTDFSDTLSPSAKEATRKMWAHMVAAMEKYCDVMEREKQNRIKFWTNQ